MLNVCRGAGFNGPVIDQTPCRSTSPQLTTKYHSLAYLHSTCGPGVQRLSVYIMTNYCALLTNGDNNGNRWFATGWQEEKMGQDG